MKPSVETTYTCILLVQIGALFTSWWYGFFAADNAPLQIAIFILVIGFIGGIVIRKQSSREANRPLKQKTLTLIICSILVTIGVYPAFVPLMVIFNEGALHVLILITGVLVPIVMRKRITRKKGEVNA